MLGMLGAERTLPCSLAGSSKRSVSSVAVAQSRTAGAAEEQVRCGNEMSPGPLHWARWPCCNAFTELMTPNITVQGVGSPQQPPATQTVAPSIQRNLVPRCPQEAVAGVQGAFTTSSGRRTAATAEKSTPDWRRAATPRQRGTSSSSSSMLPRQQHRAAWSAALAVVACLGLAAAPLAAHAAVKLGGDTDMEGSSLLTPTRGEVMGRTFYFEIPHNPVGVLFMAHGCVHDAADFWPPSKACPECSGGDLARHPRAPPSRR